MLTMSKNKKIFLDGFSSLPKEGLRQNRHIARPVVSRYLSYYTTVHWNLGSFYLCSHVESASPVAICKGWQPRLLFRARIAGRPA